MTPDDVKLLCTYFSLASMDLCHEEELSEVTSESVESFSLERVHEVIREFQDKQAHGDLVVHAGELSTL